MRGRIWILSLLALGTLLYRGFHIYEFFLDTTRSQALPFSCVVQDGHLVVHSIGGRAGERSSPVYQAGLRRNDRILEAFNSRGKGLRINGLFDFGDALRSSPKYEPWILLIERSPFSQELGVVLPSQADQKLKPNDMFLQLWLGLLLPLLVTISAFYIGFLGFKEDRGFYACLLLLCLASVVATQRNLFAYPPGIRLIGLLLQTAQVGLAGYFFFRISLLVPAPSVLEQKVPWLKRAALFLSVAAFAFSLLLELAKAASFERYSILVAVFPFAESFSMLSSFLMLLLGTISVVLNIRQSQAQDDRRRALLLFAAILAFLVSYFVLNTYSHSGLQDASMGIAALSIVAGISFQVILAYVVMERRVFGFKQILRRGTRYVLASHGSYVIASALIFTGLYLTIGAATFHLEVSTTPGFEWRLGAIAALSFGLAMMLPRISRKLMPYIERKLFQESFHSHRILGDLGRAIQRQPIKPELLMDLAISQINRALSVDRMSVFLRGAKIVDSSEEAEEFSIAWIRRNAIDYQCCEIRDRSESEKLRIISPDELQDYFLPFDSAIVKTLQERMSEPKVLELYSSEPLTGELMLPAESMERTIVENLKAKILVPMITNRQMLGFLTLGEKPSEEPYSLEEKELLLGIANQMAIAVEYSQQSDRIAEQEKLRREIDIAKQVQLHLFPQRLPAMKSIDYVGICKAAREVGGDYYDFLEIGPGRLGFVVADISGKGISAALLMASLQALLRSHAHLHGDRSELLVWDINRLMHSSTSNGKYASLFYGFYDDLSRLLAYVNAGHLPPILYRKDGSTARLNTGGMVVGMMPDSTYRQEIIKLEQGDILLIFSDGITEAMNLKDQEFGEERLIQLIAPLADLPAQSISEGILKSISEYVGTAPQHDDSTLVVIKAV